MGREAVRRPGPTAPGGAGRQLPPPGAPPTQRRKPSDHTSEPMRTTRMQANQTAGTVVLHRWVQSGRERGRQRTPTAPDPRREPARRSVFGGRRADGGGMGDRSGEALRTSTPRPRCRVRTAAMECARPGLRRSRPPTPFGNPHPHFAAENRPCLGNMTKHLGLQASEFRHTRRPGGLFLAAGDLDRRLIRERPYARHSLPNLGLTTDWSRNGDEEKS